MFHKPPNYFEITVKFKQFKGQRIIKQSITRKRYGVVFRCLTCWEGWRALETQIFKKQGNLAIRKTLANLKKPVEATSLSREGADVRLTPVYATTSSTKEEGKPPFKNQKLKAYQKKSRKSENPVPLLRLRKNLRLTPKAACPLCKGTHYPFSAPSLIRWPRGRHA